MSLDRQAIEKRDFPISRRGYETLAVDAHLAQLAREGTTMLMATHDLRLAATIAGNVVHLDAGEIVESGPARDVFGAPREERTKRFISTLTAATRV